jgi:AraC-type transcriptional regulator N-terminus
VGQAGNQRITNSEQPLQVAEMRRELAHKIAAHAPKAGAQATVIPGLTLYRRTAPSPCYPVTYEPSLNVFVQGRKRVNLGGTTYLCDESTFLLSSIDLPVVSQIVRASEEVPLLSLLLKLDMPAVREILSQEGFQRRESSFQGRGIAIGTTTVDLLKPCSRLLDLLDAPEDIPFLSNLIQHEIVYRLLRSPQGERLRAIATLGDQSQKNGDRHCLAEGQLRKAVASRGARRSRAHGHVDAAPSLPRLDGNEPTSIPEAASIACCARANAD